MVLGVVVIVLLIWGFSSGWSSMWDKITSFGGGKSNVDTIIQACNLACTSNQEYAYCTQTRNVETSDGKKITGKSCAQLTEIGVAPCSNLDCNGKTPKIMNTQTTGTPQTQTANSGVIGEAVAITLPEESIQIAMNQMEATTDNEVYA